MTQPRGGGSPGVRGPRRGTRGPSAGRPRPATSKGAGRTQARRRGARLGDPRRRLRAGMLVMAFVLSLFVGRLVQLQGLDPQAYAAKAERARLHTVTLSATRGSITDRDGVALARTVDARAVTADPSMVDHPARTAARLAPVVGVDEDVLAARLSRPGKYALLAKELTPQQGTAVDGLGLTGVFVVDTHDRVYPAHDVAANLVGFVGGDGKGLGGLEYSLDDVLAGHDGSHTYERGLDGHMIPSGKDAEQAAVPGRDVRLTIDRDIQWAAQKALAHQVKAAKAESGTVVVMNPRTGKLLALATSPTFDPNQAGKAPARNRGNRAVSDVYEPGSTGKVMTAAAAVQAGAVRPGTPITVPGTLDRRGTTFHDDVAHGTWHLTFAGVIAKSSNIGTIKTAQRTGLHRVYRTMRAFGIGQPLGASLPGASSGYLPPPSKWSSSTPYTLAFGQGYSVNTVQMASVYATIANGGVRVEPSVVDGYVEPDGSYRKAAAPKRTRVVSAGTAHTVTKILEQVTQDGGTAPMAAIEGYRVAGKTGTANRVDPSCGCYRGYTASFIGFAPADDPGLVVAVTLQNPKNGHFGGMLGGPVFTKVMSFALKTQDVPPTGTKAPRLPLESR